MKYRNLLIVPALLSGACQPAPGVDSTRPAEAELPASAETTPTLVDGANDAAIHINFGDPAKSLILGAGIDGLEIYGLGGSRVEVVDDRPVTFVDIAQAFPLAGNDTSLAVVYDPSTTELVAYALGSGTPSMTRVSDAPIETATEVEGLCLYRSPLTGKHYAFVSGDGHIQQWELFEETGRVSARKIRVVPVGLGAGHCVAHDRQAAIYYSQETVGVWKLDAEPESEAVPVAVAFALPHGPFTGDTKGIAIYEHEGGGYLLVSDADVGMIWVFDLESYEHLGAFTVPGVQETEGIAVSSGRLSDAFDTGLVVLADDDNGDEHANYKLLSWSAIAGELGLEVMAGPVRATNPAPSAITVVPSVETVPVASYGDAADDPAIWVHPDRPELSMIIGSQKQHGVNVYDLEGTLLQSIPDGRVNNVDVRYNFPLDGESADIVAGSNRTSDSISMYRVDPGTRTLENITDGVIPTGMSDPYGLCLYRSPVTGEYYVFVNDKGGVVKQFRLEDRGNGRIGADVVRELRVGSQTEGCVADDATGDIYIGEEGVAVWKYRAEPDAGDSRSMVDSIEDGNLDGDIEGLAIYYGAGGSGYLIVSNQGVNNYAVYERAGDNRFIGLFHVVGDGETGIDGASETDGLDVTSANLGPAFPAGVFVAQDGRNITPDERQNFKLVPWERIAEAMGLTIHSGYDPRQSAAGNVRE